MLCFAKVKSTFLWKCHVSVRTVSHTWDLFSHLAPASQGHQCAVVFKSGLGACSLPDCLSSMPDFPAFFIFLFFGLVPRLRPCRFLDCPVRLSPGNKLPFPDHICFCLPLLDFWLPGSTSGYSFHQWTLPTCNPLSYRGVFTFGLSLLNPCVSPSSCEQFSSFINKGYDWISEGVCCFWVQCLNRVKKWLWPPPV